MRGRLSVLFILAMCMGVSAYAIEPLKSDIPFSFVVGDQLLPAGTYRIVSATTTGGGVLLIRRVDGHEAMFAPTRSIERSNFYEVITTWKLGVDYEDVNVLTPVKETKSAEFCLAFNRYGNEYFLSRVWIREDGREFFTSAAEKAAMAVNVLPTKHETVVLAASAR